MVRKLVLIALVSAIASACSYRSERVVQPTSTTTTQRTTTVSPDPAVPPVTTTTTTTTPAR
jgi:hypothetical protein